MSPSRSNDEIRARGRAWYAANIEHYRAYSRNWYAANREKRRVRAAGRRLLSDNAKDQPCMDCGLTFPPYVMDFDHRPTETKQFQISTDLNRSVANLRAEIAKCDVVCSNCHRERTHQRRRSRGA